MHDVVRDDISARSAAEKDVAPGDSPCMSWMPIAVYQERVPLTTSARLGMGAAAESSRGAKLAIEYLTGAIYIQDQDQVGACTLSADRLCAVALSESDSADVIVARIEILKTSSED